MSEQDKAAPVEQEPVAWMTFKDDEPYAIEWKKSERECVPLYTHPKEWVGLTDEEIWEQWHTQPKEGAVMVPAFARAIEAKLKEKNDN